MQYFAQTSLKDERLHHFEKKKSRFSPLWIQAEWQIFMNSSVVSPIQPHYQFHSPLMHKWMRTTAWIPTASTRAPIMMIEKTRGDSIYACASTSKRRKKRANTRFSNCHLTMDSFSRGIPQDSNQRIRRLSHIPRFFSSLFSSALFFFISPIFHHFSLQSFYLFNGHFVPEWQSASQ